MGEEVRGVPEAAPLSPSEGIGRYLAKQRRLRGISLQELADVTRIPRRSLERLEAGAFDGQNDGFARGFVRTVAAALGLDPDETVNRLAREPEEPDGPGRRWPGLPAGAPLAGLALALAAVVAAILLLRFAPAWLESSAAPEREPARAPVLRRDPVRDLAREGVRPPPPEPPAP